MNGSNQRPDAVAGAAAASRMRSPYAPGDEGDPIPEPPRARRWDEPPDTEPPPPDAELYRQTFMIIYINAQLEQAGQREAFHVSFNASGALVGALTGPQDTYSHLFFYDAVSGQRVSPRQLDPYVKVLGSFAFAPGPDDRVVLCPTAQTTGANPALRQEQRIDLYDMGKRTRTGKWETSARFPLAYAPDGSALAAVSSRDARHVVLLSATNGQIKAVFPIHEDEVTHLAFSHDGTGIVSLSKDGSCRLTSRTTGRLLRRFEVSSRHNPRLLQVAPDGGTVASVWGREVILWNPGTGDVRAYNLSSVRASEGWPLCISPDCQYLACRTEDGFDVLDLSDGRFLGEFLLRRSFVTCAAFNHDATRLAIGKYNGEIQLYNTVVARQGVATQITRGQNTSV